MACRDANSSLRNRRWGVLTGTMPTAIAVAERLMHAAVQELRRGMSQASTSCTRRVAAVPDDCWWQAGIYSLTFSTGAHWLCVSSDAGTAHVSAMLCPQCTLLSLPDARGWAGLLARQPSPRPGVGRQHHPPHHGGQVVHHCLCRLRLRRSRGLLWVAGSARIADPAIPSHG